MANFIRICCAVDFSDCSRKALLAAADLARRDGAALTVLHVREDTMEAGGSPITPSAGPMDGRSLPALETLRAEAEGIRGASVGSAIVGGMVAPSITQFAKDAAADLLVLGSHGRTGMARRALGSVAEAVLRTAPCPVLVIRGPDAACGEVDASTPLGVVHAA